MGLDVVRFMLRPERVHQKRAIATIFGEHMEQSTWFPLIQKRHNTRNIIPRRCLKVGAQIQFILGEKYVFANDPNHRLIEPLRLQLGEE